MQLICCGLLLFALEKYVAIPFTILPQLYTKYQLDKHANQLSLLYSHTTFAVYHPKKKKKLNHPETWHTHN